MHDVADGHFQVAELVANRLVDEGKATAVILHGSGGQSTHRPDSDVDLVAIAPASTGLSAYDVNGLRVEIVGRCYEDWIGVFSRPIPSWVHAWTDGRMLRQTGGAGDRLVDCATQTLRTFRARDETLLGHVEFWGHVRPKLADVVVRGETSEVGYEMALSMPQLVESLFLINDVVPPPASNAGAFRRLRSLGVQDVLGDRLDRLFSHSSAEVRGREKLALIDELQCGMRRRPFSKQGHEL